MKKLVGLIVLALAALNVASAQNSSGPANLYFAGLSYNKGATPAVAGTALYARNVNSAGTYAFTLMDVLPSTTRPLTVNTSIGIGIAQRVSNIGKVGIYMPTGAGVDYTGTNVGWAWSTGMGAVVPLPNNFYLMPNLRTVKSSVSNGQGYQVIFGVLFGWGR